MAINTRSPYFVSTTDADISYATLNLFIWTGALGDKPASAQYSLRKTVITGSIVINFEIAELIADYIETTFDGDYTSQAVYVQHTTTALSFVDATLDTDTVTTYAYDSYSYFEEPTFDIDDSSVMISNRKVFILADNLFRIPFNATLNPVVTYFNNNIELSTQTLSEVVDSTVSRIQYASLNGTSTNYDSYKERVLEDSGTFEDSICLTEFLDSVEINAVDKIQVSDANGITIIDVCTVDECRYTPKKITFINKFGALQDMYFFKKNTEQIRIKKESYKSNIITASNTYSISNHVKRDFNITGQESITLSSGYLSEDYNEVFKQMMLSEKVWITNIIETGEQVLPINVTTSDIKYKTSVNDKLVEYTISFDNSHNVLNNVR